MPTYVNWCTLLRDLLCSLDLEVVWMYQSVGNKSTLLIYLKKE